MRAGRRVVRAISARVGRSVPWPHSGRTSIVPNAAIGWAAAISTASSMLAASIRSKPPTASLVSANGPSVTSRCPSRRRTDRARRGGASWSPIVQAPRARRSSSHGNDSFSAGSAPGAGTGSVSAFIRSASQQTSSRYFMRSPSSCASG